MSKQLKIIYFILFLFISSLITMVVIVDKKIDPSEIRESVAKSIKAISPGTNVSIAKVDYSMGTVVRIYLNQILLEKDKNKVLALKKIIIKIPLHTILLGAGKIQITVDGPHLYKHLHDLQSLNAFDQQIVLRLPSFVKNSKIDLKIENIESTDFSEKIIFKKILFKNLNLAKNMAYEIIANINDPSNHGLRARTQLVGEINLKELSNDKVLKSKIFLNFLDIKNDKDLDIPSAKGSVDLKILNFQNIQGSVTLNADGIGDSVFSFLLKDEKLKVSNLQTQLSNQLLFRFLPQSEKEKFDPENSHSVISGDLTYELLKKTWKPNLLLKINKPFNIKFAQQTFSATVDARILDEKVEAKVVSNTLGGFINADVRIFLDKHKNSSEKVRVKSIEGDLQITGIRLDHSFFNDYFALFVQNEKKVLEVEYSDSNNERNSTKVKLNITANNNFLEDTQISFECMIFSDSSDNLNLKIKELVTPSGRSSINLKYSFIQKMWNFDFKTEGINIKEMKPLFPAMFSTFEGIANTEGRGFYQKAKNSPQYKLALKLKLNQFAVGFIDLAPSVNEFLSKIEQRKLFNTDEKLNSFTSLETSFVHTSDGTIIKKADIIAERIKLKNIRGEIKNNGPSYIKGALFIDKRIPFSFVGYGRILNPDIKYSQAGIK